MSSLREFVDSNKEKAGSSSMKSLLDQGSSAMSSTWSFISNSSGGNGDQSHEMNHTGESDGWFSKAKEDPCLPSLSKKQRILGFMLCLAMGVFCFVLCSLYLPVLIFKARKFALLYTLGSVFFIMSFSMLWGPVNHLKHLFSGERLPFTVVYFLTLGATIYFAMWRRSLLMTLICAMFQILALVWYIVSYIPGGQTGLKFFSKIFYVATTRTAQHILPM